LTKIIISTNIKNIDKVYLNIKINIVNNIKKTIVMLKKKAKGVSSIMASYGEHEGVVYFNTLSVSDKFATIDFIPTNKVNGDKRDLRGIPCKDLIVTEKNKKILWEKVNSARIKENTLQGRAKKRENRKKQRQTA